MPKRLPYDIEELKRLYLDEELGCDAVAERIGMGTGAAVRNHLRQAGCPMRPSSRKIKWPVDDIKRLYWSEQKTSMEIAADLGVSATQVRRVLVANGGMRKRGSSTKNRRHANAPRWRGGRTVDSFGYVRIFQPDSPMASKAGYVAEHRLVAAQMLGRLLRRDEVVHHINGIKHDNRPENLHVMSASDHKMSHAECFRELMRLRQMLSAISDAGASVSA